MSRRRLYFLFFGVMWMLLIFTFSHRPAIQSDQDSKVFVETFSEVQEDINNISISKGHRLNYSPIYIVRKAAHVILYAILTYLLYNVFYVNDFRLYKPFFLAILFSVLYAISDEIHQTFIPGRKGLAADVIIDSYGVIIGGLLTLITYKCMPILKRRWCVKRVIEIFFSGLIFLPVALFNIIGYRVVSTSVLWQVILGRKLFIGNEGIIEHQYNEQYALYEDLKVLVRRVFYRSRDVENF